MDRLQMHTSNLANENFRKLVELFPNAVTEKKDPVTGKIVRAIDADVLRQEISGQVVEGREERYQFTWPDKKKAMLAANAPIAATLRPVREESVGKDGTPGGWDSQNLYIEGDNLDVLKLLQETYLGKIKLIYIDPPYNTGKDFIYEDDFAEDIDVYLARSGQFDDQGNRLEVNTDTNGRFHTDWLNMMYCRLKLAKNLLTDDGVIFISIDDGELDNLKKICDEIYGAVNYVNIVSANMKNIAGASGGGEDKRLKKNCEYILIYAKNYQLLKPFAGIYSYKEMYEYVEQYRNEGKNWHYTSVLVEPGEKEYVGSTVDGDGNEIKIYRRPGSIIRSIKQLCDEKRISEKDVYYQYGTRIFEAKDAQSSIRTRVIKARDTFDLKDDVISIEYVPKTGKNKGQIYEQFYKGDNCRLFAWLKDISDVIDGVLYKKDAQGTYWDLTGYINNLSKEGDIAFPNGKKPIALIERMMTMQDDKDLIVLDFFSGSASSAHAVLKLNADDGGNRRFIMVQLPEIIDAKDDLFKAGFETICDVGKECIRRAGKKIKEEVGLTYPNLDIGFRVLRLDSSNMEDVYYNPVELSRDLLGRTVDNIKIDRSGEDLLFQVMLDLGVELSSTIDVRMIGGKKVFIVKPVGIDKAYLIACFDKGVSEDIVTEIAKMQPYYAVFRDNGMASDSVATNFDQIFETYSSQTVRKVL